MSKSGETFEEIRELFKIKPSRPPGGFPRGSTEARLELKLDRLCRLYQGEHGHSFWSEYYRQVEIGRIPLAL